MTERLYYGYTLEQIEKMGGDNEACIAYDMIAHIRELEADLARVTAERDARLILRRREDHPALFEDGDTYLVGLRANHSRATEKRSATPDGVFWEWAVVTIRCDEDYFEVYEVETQEPWGWGWQDVEVWCRLTPAAALEALKAKMEERK